MTARNDARAVADVANGLVLASVEIAAPPERVFKALTSAEDVIRWWGAEGAYRTTEWEADVRPGGKWRAGGKAPDGTSYQVQGEYVEVEAPHKLVFTWRPDWDAPNETRVTYLLEPVEAGTHLTLRHEGFANRTLVCRNHGDGWGRVLGWLEADLRPVPAPSAYFLYRLIPPRPTFIHDAAPDELSIMRTHGIYWRGKLAEGKAIAFGPVADPAGSWGVGIMRVSGLAEAEALAAADPAITSGAGFRSEVFAMPSAIHA
jgi:uncharacterized protein YndB with AHSA1/START domain